MAEQKSFDADLAPLLWGEAVCLRAHEIEHRHAIGFPGHAQRPQVFVGHATGKWIGDLAESGVAPRDQPGLLHVVGL